MAALELEAVIRAKFGGEPNVAAVYLFGSRARGTARSDSDVDLGILYRSSPAATLLAQPFGQQVELSSELGTAVESW